jgi:hypothetical protein
MSAEFNRLLLFDPGTSEVPNIAAAYVQTMEEDGLRMAYIYPNPDNPLTCNEHGVDYAVEGAQAVNEQLGWEYGSFELYGVPPLGSNYQTEQFRWMDNQAEGPNFRESNLVVSQESFDNRVDRFTPPGPGGDGPGGASPSQANFETDNSVDRMPNQSQYEDIDPNKDLSEYSAGMSNYRFEPDPND